MKKYESHKKNIRFSIAAKSVVLAALLVFLWEDNAEEMYAFNEKDEFMRIAYDSFLKDLGGSTEHWYSEGWPDGGRPLKNSGWN